MIDMNCMPVIKQNVLTKKTNRVCPYLLSNGSSEVLPCRAEADRRNLALEVEVREHHSTSVIYQKRVPFVITAH